MIRICAWCKANLDSSHADQTGPVTHGICDDCLKLMLDGPTSMNEFLDSMSQALLVVSSDTTVISANQAACDLFGTSCEKFHGTLCGDAMLCIHSRNPEGCGETIHCKSCTIRNSVIHTYDTGEPCVQVPAYLDVIDSKVTKDIRFLISTEKVEDAVFLKIEEIDPGANGEA